MQINVGANVGSLPTFESVLDECHRVVVLAGAHGLDTRAKARDWQHDDIANLLGCLHAGEVLPRDVALAGFHVEKVGVVEEAKDGIGPARGTGELDYALVVLGELALSLALECLVGDVRYNVDEDGVTGLGLHGPLTELDAARVPLCPIWAVRVGLNANDHAVAVCGDV